MSRVDEIRARLAAATKWPWIWDEPSNWHGLDARVFVSEPYSVVALIPIEAWRPRSIGRANAALIAAAPEDISYLLERVEKLEGLLNEVADDDPCRLDHHGFCQAHGFTESPCPVAEARTLLADESKENEQ